MFRLVSFLLAGLLATASAQAATFRLGGDPSLNCDMTIEGEIVAGDAVRFRQMLANFIDAELPDPNVDDFWNDVYGTSGRICLDSPGGSMLEAIEMADTLAFGYLVRSDIAPELNAPDAAATVIWQIGTAVPAGARCESACAILFMAGGSFSSLGTSDNVRDPNRILHVDGRLGFHAPSLTVREGDYSEETVSQAFGLAIETIEELAVRLTRYRFPPSLFRRMISTPPNEMTYVETVSEAANWFIPLAGAPLIADPSYGNLDRVCDNLTSSRTGETAGWQYSTESAPEAIRAETLPFFGLSDSVGFDGDYWWIFSAEDNANTVVRGTTEFSLRECGYTYDVTSGDLLFFEAPAVHESLAINLNNGTMIPGNEPYGWLLFPGYTTISELSALNRAFPSGRVPGDTLLSEVIDVLSGQCSVYDTSNRLISAEACSAQLVSRQRADRRGHQDALVVAWPEGNATALSSTIVGNDSYLSGSGQVNAMTTDGRCERDPSSGATRCFVLEEVVSSTPSRFRR